MHVFVHKHPFASNPFDCGGGEGGGEGGGGDGGGDGGGGDGLGGGGEGRGDLGGDGGGLHLTPQSLQSLEKLQLSV
jgi:hypothetical protein